MILSNWEYSKGQSSYHFDKSRRDRPGEWFQVLGRFPCTWTDDLAEIKSAAQPLTWENRKYTMNRREVSPMLEQEEYDIKQGGGDPKMALVDAMDRVSDYPSLQAVVDHFALEQCKSRIHVQNTGQVWNMHIDKIGIMYPGVPVDKIVRIVIMLQDWEPGHFYMYGNMIYDRWKAGEAHWFDWLSVPHCTANASHVPRYSLQVWGIKTARTEEILTYNQL